VQAQNERVDMVHGTTFHEHRGRRRAELCIRLLFALEPRGRSRSSLGDPAEGSATLLSCAFVGRFWGIDGLLREMSYAWSLLTTDFGRMRVKRRSRFGTS